MSEAVIYISSFTIMYFIQLWYIKARHKPLKKRVGDKFEVLDEITQNEYITMLVSVIYSIISSIIGSICIYKYGVSTYRDSNLMERMVFYNGVGFFIFDTIAKYLLNVNLIFVWIHHALGLMYLFYILSIDKLASSGAFCLFAYEVTHPMFAFKITMEMTNYPKEPMEYKDKEKRKSVFQQKLQSLNLGTLGTIFDKLYSYCSLRIFLINFWIFGACFITCRIFLVGQLMYLSVIDIEVPITYLVIGSINQILTYHWASMMVYSLWKTIPQWFIDQASVRKSKLYITSLKMVSLIFKSSKILSIPFLLQLFPSALIPVIGAAIKRDLIPIY